MGERGWEGEADRQKQTEREKESNRQTETHPIWGTVLLSLLPCGIHHRDLDQVGVVPAVMCNAHSLAPWQRLPGNVDRGDAVVIDVLGVQPEPQVAATVVVNTVLCHGSLLLLCDMDGEMMIVIMMMIIMIMIIIIIIMI